MPIIREARCSCGQLRLTCEGEPFRISICHCLDCQRRTGSVFGTQARFPRGQITRIEGQATVFTRVADSGNTVTFHFCPACGTTLYWELTQMPEVIAVAIGAFADPGFPAPGFSFHERRQHAWVATGLPLEHLD
jgi:hypothetical protein